MPITTSSTTGDGVLSDYLDYDIEIPDSGTSVSVSGTVQPAGGVAAPMTGSPVTIPAAPGSGSLYYIVQVNKLTGALSVKQSASLVPAADAGNEAIFTQTLLPSSTDPALTPDTTPDNY